MLEHKTMVLQANNFPRGKGKTSHTFKKAADKPLPRPPNKNHKRFNEEEYERQTTKRLQKQAQLKPQGCIFKNPKTSEITIKPIKFSDLSNTSKLLATIKTIEDDYIIVSLPNMLTGYHHRNDAVSFVKLYKHLPQVCAVAISSTKSTKNQKQIEVSLDPSAVNTGITYDILQEGMILRSRVVSEEDYGYVVDVGILGVVSFLKEKVDDLDVGCILDLQISKVENKSIMLSLPSDYKEVELRGVEFQSLIPGNLLRFHVEEYCTNGVIVGFGTSYYQGAIDISNLLISAEQRNWKKYWNVYRNSVKRLVARIVCVDAASKILRLSVLPHVIRLQAVDLENLPSELQVGNVVEDVEIVRVDKSFGVLAVYPLKQMENHGNESLEEDDLSYNMQDINDYGDAFSEPKKSILKPLNHASIYIISPKPYQVGDKLPKVRIQSKKWIMDGYLQGSIDPSILSASIFSYNQLVPGKTYSCTISKTLTNTSTNDIKLYVTLGPNLTGIVNSQHFYDKGFISTYKLQALTKKYKEGMTIQAKYLLVDDYNNHYFTLKPSLLKQSEEFKDVQSIQANTKSIGYITKKDRQKGIHVMFYNHIHGIIPLHECVLQLGKDWYTVYDLGDVITTKVVKIDNFSHEDDPDGKNHRLILSLNLSSKLKEVGDAIPIGTIIDKDVMKVFEITCKDIKVIIKRNKIDDTNLIGSIPFHQIYDVYSTTDEKELYETIAELYPIGSRIPNKGIVLQYNDVSFRVIISLRPSFISTMHNIHNGDNSIKLPSSYKDIAKGESILGCIYNIDERYGTFVKYLNGITGFVPKSTHFKLYDSVVCQVLNIEDEKLVVRPKSDAVDTKCDIGDIIHVTVTSCEEDIHVETVNKKKGLIPALEVSTDLNILQNLSKYYPIGKTLQVRIIAIQETIITSLLKETPLPKVNDVVIGRINRKIRNTVPASILLDIRNENCYVRCCITELMDDWVEDEPIGKLVDRMDFGRFSHGMFVRVKILSYPTYHKPIAKSHSICLNGTLRHTQNEISIPKVGDRIQGYVITKTDTECMILASPSSCRRIVGRVIPGKPVYPVGRLVSGVVRDVCDLMNGDVGVHLDTSN